MATNLDAVAQYLDKKKYNTIDKEYRSKIATYKEWFVGYCKEFHDYKISANNIQRTLKRYSLGMAKTVCEDFATLLLNERTQINAKSFTALPDILQDNRFYERANRLIEWTMGLGTGAFVEFKDADENIIIDYIRGDQIYPLNWDSDNITECAFASARVFDKKQKGYYIQIHEKREGKYWIRNAWIKDTGEELPPQGDTEPESGPFDIPMFQIIRPNTVNSADPESPMGMSVYGGAIDQLKACDLIYDSYVNEFQLGKKRLMVPIGFAQMFLNDDGKYKQVFDPNDLIYNVYQVPDDAKDKLTAVDMTLRAEEHEKGLQRMIDLLSKRCGLGVGRYKFDSSMSPAKTATEIISEDDDLYQSIKRHEKPLERALVGMVQALSLLNGGSPDVDVSVEFDDAIFEDTGTIIKRNIELVGNSLRSKLDAIMQIDHCDEATARKKMEQIASEKMVELPDVNALIDGGENA
mgnify:FL=1